MIEIDGSHGEGGGQILRTALALSCITGKPFRLVNIRAGRPRPGLQPQHLAAVRAAAAASAARVAGEAKGSAELRFEPRETLGGDLDLAIGTAGAVTLVIQTVLPALLFAKRPSRVRVIGGTHVPWSPSWDYLTGIFLPALARIGADVSGTLRRAGFYPAGGGSVEVEVRPVAGLRSLVLLERGHLVSVTGTSGVGRLPLSIAERQRDAAATALRRALGAAAAVEIATRSVPAAGPGTFVCLKGEWTLAAAGACALGARGKRAETVGEEAAGELLAHEATGAPVDPHLADQLVPYLALAGGRSEYKTSRVTRHLLTNLWAASHFLPLRYEVSAPEGAPGVVRVVS
jgi:RNA 3'-terminal phosphate cyclase (ATP)